MSGFAQAMSVFTSPAAAEERRIMQALLLDLLDGNGLVRFTSIAAFHQHLGLRHGFTLVRNTTDGVQPGGRHLFYVHGNILLRVKTSGTRLRPVPHMTISVATGLDWSDEVAKLSRNGDLMPKLGAVHRSDHRALRRLGPDYQTLEEIDDRWADACHFNFVSGVDVTGALALTVR